LQVLPLLYNQSPNLFASLGMVVDGIE